MMRPSRAFWRRCSSSTLRLWPLVLTRLGWVCADAGFTFSLLFPSSRETSLDIVCVWKNQDALEQIQNRLSKFHAATQSLADSRISHFSPGSLSWPRVDTCFCDVSFKNQTGVFFFSKKTVFDRFWLRIRQEPPLLGKDFKPGTNMEWEPPALSIHSCYSCCEGIAHQQIVQNG